MNDDDPIPTPTKPLSDSATQPTIYNTASPGPKRVCGAGSSGSHFVDVRRASGCVTCSGFHPNPNAASQTARAPGAGYFDAA